MGLVTTAFGNQIKVNSKVDISTSQIASFLSSTDGPVMRRFTIVGDAVKDATVRSLKPGFPADFLGPSIVKRVEMTKSGPRVLVGSDRTKTEPHEIEGNPVLVFEWPKAGGTVFLRRVQHPGSDFTKYLSGKLLEAVEIAKGVLG